MTEALESILSRAGFSPSLVAATCADCGGEVPAGAGWRGPGHGSFARASFVTRCRDCAVAEVSR